MILLQTPPIPTTGTPRTHGGKGCTHCRYVVRRILESIDKILKRDSRGRKKDFLPRKAKAKKQNRAAAATDGSGQ